MNKNEERDAKIRPWGTPTVIEKEWWDRKGTGRKGEYNVKKPKGERVSVSNSGLEGWQKVIVLSDGPVLTP